MEGGCKREGAKTEGRRLRERVWGGKGRCVSEINGTEGGSFAEGDRSERQEHQRGNTGVQGRCTESETERRQGLLCKLPDHPVLAVCLSQ